MLSLVLFLYLFFVYVFICFLFFYFFACLYVNINLHLLHLDIFLLCLSFQLLQFCVILLYLSFIFCFFDCCADFYFFGQIFVSITFVEVLVSSKLFLFVEFCWCKTCHHFVALSFYSSQLQCVGFFCLFLFIYLFFPLLCKFLLLLTHVLSFFLSLHQKIMMINLTLLHLFWCLVDYFFALYFVDA